MDKIVDRLKKLREDGQMIITPDFSISYNPFKDVFVVEVPEDKKYVNLTYPDALGSFIWDICGMYPYEVGAGQDYAMAWKEMQQYTQGAAIDNLPSFTKDGKEYVWFDGDENGVKAVLKERITIVKDE